MWGLRPIALQPKGVVFTFVDLGPRLITVTHHDAVTGPYHRNGQQIADVMNSLRGSAEQAHALIAKYHANYLLSCPNSSTTTIFMAEAPKGFYVQLQRGQVPEWLAPVRAAQGFAVPDVAGGRLGRATCGKLCFRPSTTNCAASAARITPRMRVIIASTFSPISRISGPAASKVDQRHQHHRR